LPTYEYACTACGHRLEAVQSFTDDALTVCPECGGVLRKVYGAVGIAFKGSGFYKTDSRSGGASKGESKGSEPAPSTPSSDSAPKKESAPSSSGSNKPAEKAKPAASTAT
jgi:putative FmdB family regulatory protein